MSLYASGCFGISIADLRKVDFNNLKIQNLVEVTNVSSRIAYFEDDCYSLIHGTWRLGVTEISKL